jgi:hypothetical protein
MQQTACWRRFARAAFAGWARRRWGVQARLVRLIRLFSSLEYDTRLSLLWVTMARNLTLLAYLINGFACFFHLASRSFGWSSFDRPDLNIFERCASLHLPSLLLVL